MNTMYRVVILTKTQQFAVGRYRRWPLDDLTQPYVLNGILRRGHEVDPAGVGHGDYMKWSDRTQAQMYADLLNRGKAL